jgi:hypothetical protein
LASSLAGAGDVGACAEVDVGTGQRTDLADPKPGLDGEGQQGVVASAGPGVGVGRGEECVDLGGGEELDDGSD